MADAAGRRLPTFWMAAAAAAVLALTAQWLFFDSRIGWTLGAFGLAWLAVVVALRPAIRRDVLARWAALAAAGLALMLFDSPGLLGWVLFCAAVAVAALAPRSGADDAWRWAQRLAWNGLRGLFRPLMDYRRVQALRKARGAPALRVFVSLLILPLIGGAVFLTLFAQANPIISNVLSALRLPPLDPLMIMRTIFFGFALVVVWSVLRPRTRRKLLPLPDDTRDLKFSWLTPQSVTLSLAVFNALFLLQNGLDLVFLWSGAPLPEGVTLADYAHRGAYPLIVTALLAGAFVLVALRPASETAARPLIRRLVVLWVLQNLLLVASSMLRTVDYVEVYSLTVLRIAALAWMVLVAVGLGLICWRLLKAKSGAWLVNANTLAVGVVLTLATAVEFSSVAAAWNVRNALEVNGRGASLDVCYLQRLGPAALVSLAQLEQRPLDPVTRARVAGARSEVQGRLEARQADWRGWTWRGARRLAAVRGLPKALIPPLEARHCDGTPVVLPPVPPPVVPPAAPPAPGPERLTSTSPP